MQRLRGLENGRWDTLGVGTEDVGGQDRDGLVS